MHYYSFNIGDYASATAHLELLEDLAYRRLLDLYYSSEQPIPLDIKQSSRLIRMRSHCDFITSVLEEFFTKEDDGWHCDRVDVEIFKYAEKSYKASKSAKTRWKKAKKKQQDKIVCERIANAEETQCDGNANQEPLTNNQEPLTNNQEPLTNIKDPLVQPEAKPKKYKYSDYDLQIAEWIHERVVAINPTQKKPNFEAWANSLRLMQESDKRSIEDVIKIFTWANSDPFWQSNILSPDKLRKKYDELMIKSKSSTGKNINQIGTNFSEKPEGWK